MKAKTAPRSEEAILCEVAWEVCNQIGGIYTVVRSKVPRIGGLWGDAYCLVGPYVEDQATVEFEEIEPAGWFGEAAARLTARGYKARFGRWLVTGKPQVVLLETAAAQRELAHIKHTLWRNHGLELEASNPLVDEVLAFGHVVEAFFHELGEAAGKKLRVIGHFHEWMAGTAIPGLRHARSPVRSVFTTHATSLGRFLAMEKERYYDAIPGADWRAEGRRYNMDAQVQLERASAQCCDVFTTVSEITAFECEHLLGRKPDLLLPNGLNIERFVALHEFQNLHKIYKDKITQFVMGHFFPSYSFDLDKTLYCFVSGRYEYRNKGFDLTIEAMARLNWMMKQARSDRTVICFLVTKAATRSIQAEALRTRAVLEEIHKNCQAIQQVIGDRLFVSAASGGQWPALDDLIPDYWRFRLRRNLQAWKARHPPSPVTHDLAYPNDDAIYNQLKACKLLNAPGDPVKIVYHPDFITSGNPLFGMDYDQFVRGCHLGIFPSHYEPWGYAPMECVALGIPAITSDLAGFGAYLLSHIPDHASKGTWVTRRRHRSFDESATELATCLNEFVKLDRRERIALRNRVESCSAEFDWSNLGRYYDEAYQLAAAR